MEPWFGLGSPWWLVLAFLTLIVGWWPEALAYVKKRSEKLTRTTSKPPPPSPNALSEPQSKTPKLQSWEVPGARTERFKIYEAACLLIGEEPSWPLLSVGAREEYNVLVGDAENCNLTVIPQKDTQGQEFDLAWTKGDDGPEALRNIEVHRKELRKYLRSIGRPIPKFLHEKFDDAPPPPPDPVLIDLDVRILRFLVEWEKLQIKEGRVMTNSHVHCQFTGEQEESVLVLDQRLIHLEKTGYITATVEPKPSLGIPETKYIEIHGVTEKGRRALRA